MRRPSPDTETGGVNTELRYAECLDLLRGSTVGRVALCSPAGPRIVPVNYRVAGMSLVFRTRPHGTLGTYGPGARVAFETDRIDHVYQSGVSVVALGRLDLVDDPEEIGRLSGVGSPESWAGGPRQLLLRLPWADLTGRRVSADWPSTPTMTRDTW